MPECSPTVSMVGDDEIVSLLGHTLQWLLAVSNPTGEEEKSSGIQVHGVISHLQLGHEEQVAFVDRSPLCKHFFLT